MKKESRYIIKLKTINEEAGLSRSCVDDYIAYPVYFKTYDEAVRKLGANMDFKRHSFVPAFSIIEYGDEKEALCVDFVKPLKFYITGEEYSSFYHDKINKMFDEFLSKHSFI